MTPSSISPVPPPLPGRPIIGQRWSDITFLHWRVDPARVAPLLPEGTRPDVFDGAAWVGLIPFLLSRTRIPPGPPIPWLGTFPETNVRLYSVDETGRRGVVFASLDAAHLVPVLTARAVFGLPYRWAGMRMERRGDRIAYRSRRHSRNGPSSHVIARVLDEAVTADPLADFLTARWGFHQRHLGNTCFGPNSHRPWPLQRAELLHLDDDLLAAAGFPDLASRPPDSALYSRGVDTVFSRPIPVA
ncbi:DUF2071 domain-containing protein [Naasia sp. SYSU D00948]|uniref:YqjF family protein n=1 Tax=Naasia sp. SYSU D00948 TaxID=2817379 RepID=UPI0027DE12A0|nr:DUF2071 domain-containing protein [Naasia sp. SYSU D00948]